jgi:coproporphyrinogen III oxidase-like Fe-S oxidoreductase
MLGNIDSVKEHINLNDVSKEVGIEVNAEKTKYMLLSHHQNAGQNHNLKIDIRSFANMEQLKIHE